MGNCCYHERGEGCACECHQPLIVKPARLMVYNFATEQFELQEGEDKEAWLELLNGMLNPSYDYNTNTANLPEAEI